MPNTSITAQLRYPAPSDPPDGAGALGNLAMDVDDRFSRAQITNGGTFVGQRAYVGPLEYRWNGSSWDLMALPSMISQAYQANTSYDATVPANGSADVENNTVIVDAFSMRQSDGVSFKLPWAGRYSLFTRVSFTNDDTSASYELRWYNVTDQALISTQLAPPIRSSVPVTTHVETVVSAAGKVIKPQVFRNSTGSQYIRHFDATYRSNFSLIRYLGVA